MPAFLQTCLDRLLYGLARLCAPAELPRGQRARPQAVAPTAPAPRVPGRLPGLADGPYAVRVSGLVGLTGRLCATGGPVVLAKGVVCGLRLSESPARILLCHRLLAPAAVMQTFSSIYLDAACPRPNLYFQPDGVDQNGVYRLEAPVLTLLGEAAQADGMTIWHNVWLHAARLEYLPGATLPAATLPAATLPVQSRHA